MGLKDEIISKTVDLRGKCCPSPVLEMKLAFLGVKGGEIVELILDSEVETFSKFYQKSKLEYECIEIEPSLWRFLIRKPLSV